VGLLVIKYLYGDQVEDVEMGGVCSTHMRREIHSKVWLENVEQVYNFRVQSVVGRLILKILRV